MNLRFERANKSHEPIIFAWLAEPHMQAFWDNSQEHKDDIRNFIHGRMQSYFCGTTQYWIAYLDDQPFGFLLTDEMTADQKDLSDLHRQNLSTSGHSIGIDFGIGNKEFLNKGLAAPTLRAFIDFFRVQVDRDADTFFIDPLETNPRARHVYEKAGFTKLGTFEPSLGAFVGQESRLMILQFQEALDSDPN